MSKSRKKKSGKQQVSSQTLGALALIISIVALGFSMFQFIARVDSGLQIYMLERDDIIWLDKYASFDYLYELNITYSTNVGDTVVVEFNCFLYLEASGTTTLEVIFDINGTILPPPGIYVRSDSNVYTTGYMKYSYEASTAGENQVLIWTMCDQETDNYIKDCLLTVTVY